jgi:hypothetical protein
VANILGFRSNPKTGASTMSDNLITAGFIHPAELPIEAIRQQVATFLNIPLNQIERIECWKHQIWVKIVASKAQFVSYRCLPLWLEQGLAVIKAMPSRLDLDQLGEILRTEREWYDQQEMPEAVQPWRYAWAQQAKFCRQEAARLQPIIARQQAEDNWYQAWFGVLGCCRDLTGIQQLSPEIKHRSLDFADLPDVAQAMQQLVKQRWQEIQKLAV